MVPFKDVGPIKARTAAVSDIASPLMSMPDPAVPAQCSPPAKAVAHKPPSTRVTLSARATPSTQTVPSAHAPTPHSRTQTSALTRTPTPTLALNTFAVMQLCRYMSGMPIQVRHAYSAHADTQWSISAMHWNTWSKPVLYFHTGKSSTARADYLPNLT